MDLKLQRLVMDILVFDWFGKNLYEKLPKDIYKETNFTIK